MHTADEPVAMEEIDDEDDNDNGSGYLDVQEDDHDSLDSSRANDVDENNNSILQTFLSGRRRFLY